MAELVRALHAELCTFRWLLCCFRSADLHRAELSFHPSVSIAPTGFHLGRAEYFSPKNVLRLWAAVTRANLMELIDGNCGWRR